MARKPKPKPKPKTKKKTPKKRATFRLSKEDRKLLKEQEALDAYYKKREHAKKQKRITKAIRKTPEGKRYRVIQSGPILIERRGYFVTIHALVPASWATSSTPVFEPVEGSEGYHLVVWRTPVRQTLQAALAEYDQLLIDQSVYSDVNEMQFVIISGEMMILHEDHSSYLIKGWSGDRPPRWLRRTAKKLSKE